ncbi:hypothetical protein HDU67_006905 [Dinochytrium kinnereticum]|nr:hypothetical protein HDU67_006905 [Dinochytrium kinnereticum]
MSKRLRVDEEDAAGNAVHKITAEEGTDEELLHKKPQEAETTPSINAENGPDDKKLAETVDSYIASLSASSFMPKPGKSYLSEEDVGITAFVESSLQSFSGIIKQRYSDFLVNEVDYTGKILRLDTLHEANAKEEESNESEKAPEVVLEVVLNELRALVESEEVINKVELVVKEKKKFEAFYIEAIDDKDKRRDIHEFFKKNFGDVIVTDSVPDKRIRLRYSDNKGKGNRPRVDKKMWEAMGGQYLEFVLYKENKDTMEALNLISKAAGVSAKAFTFAGTKDKRGITVQRVTAHRVMKVSLESIGTSINGMRLGSFKYVEDRVKLGDLAGNHFAITLRDVRPQNELSESIEDIVQKSLASLKEKGFINYYGMQRFGTRAVSTHTVGIAMLAGRWDVAVELILMPKGDEREDFVKAREHWMTHHDPQAAFDLFPRSCTAERSVLLSLIKQKNKRDYFQALLCIPRNLRLMYIHAVQSYVWNHMASERIKRYGPKVVLGDLVAIDSNSGEGGAAKDGPMEVDDEITAEDSRLSRMIEAEVITTQEQADSCSLENVVLPLPGYNITYPKNDIGELYKTFMANFGMDPHNMRRKNREMSLSGDYRRLLARPTHVDCRIVKYNDPNIHLSLTDVDMLMGKEQPKSVEDGERLALVCEFTLEPSSYATMALREILKSDTSAGHQTQLTTATHSASSIDVLMRTESKVSDHLLDLFGMADRNIVDFMIASAKSAKSDSKLLNTLQAAADLPQTDHARQFVSDLFQKVPRPRLSAAKEEEKRRRAEEREKANLLKKNTEFKLLLDEDEDVKARKDLDISQDIKSKDKKKTKKMRQKDEDDKDWDAGEGSQVVKRKRKKYGGLMDSIKNYSDLRTDEEDDEEARILQDQKEVDEFNQRLKDRDNEKLKKMKEEKFSQGNEEARVRKKIAEDQDLRGQALPSLREVSRQEYLKKREDMKLLLLEREIAEEEYLFSGEKLSKRERKELEFKKTALKLAKERMKINDKPDGYMMPEDYITEKGKLDKKKQEAVLYKRYQDNEDPENFISEQSVWEDYQIQNANIRVTKMQPRTDEMEFDYVLDDSEQIQFIQSQAMEASDSDDEKEKKVEMSDAERRALTMKEVRASLPIYEFREDLLEAVKEYQVLIIVGETGSGKTTQIPQYLHEAGYTSGNRKVGCTQPRRVAAMSVATRVAEEMGTKVGADVGYSIRFEDCTSEKTVVKFMTDGMLLREFLTEPDLSSYSCLMIDEAHERTLHTDILFGLVKDIARYRKDLKLLISSATMDAEKFSKYFDDAPIFNIKGRKFPVTVFHTQAPEADYLKAAVQTIMTIHIAEPKGDILLFLTGQEEIEAAEQTLQLITKQLGSKISEMKICPIYAALPSEKQAEIFEPTPDGVRKVVLATNIAETSITIDGIVYVIDPGFCKQKSFNPKTGMESLVVVPASRAAANQRKGRAGRVQPGKCFRLYTAWAYQNELEENTIPEIQRTNLASVVLMLKSLGIDNLMSFDFMDAPPAETLMKAVEQLYALGALNSRGDLTKLGRRMAEFPIDPMLSKSLIASETYQCSEEVVSIIAMLTAGNGIFFKPKNEAVQAEQARRNFFRPGGDHISLLSVWNQYVETNFSTAWCKENYIQFRSMKKARDVREQLVGLMERVEVPLLSNPDPGNTVPIRKAITSGFFYNTARLNRSGDSYRTIKHNETVTIHPSSSLYISNSNTNTNKQYPKWVLYFELVFTTREFMRQVIEIQSDWLLEVAPHYYKPGELDDDSNKKLPKGVGKPASRM